MEIAMIKIKAVGAYFTPEGVVADSVNNPKYAKYTVEESECTYTVYATAEYAPASVAVRIPVECEAGDSLFMNGFKSDSESREHSVDEKAMSVGAVTSYAHKLFGRDASISKYKNKPGVTHGFSYCYFRSGDKVRLFASLDESTGYTVFKYDAESSTLKVTKDIEGVKCFNNYKMISLFYAEGSEAEVFDKWFEALGKSENHPAPQLVGYSTKKLESIDAGRIGRKLAAVKENFPVEPNVFIIDGEYCCVGDWLAPDEEKFPEGLRTLSDAIKAEGLMSALRISPFNVSEDSLIFEEHQDWLLRKADGKLVKIKNGCFVLDSDNAEVREYVREVLHTVLFMWGFDLVKLDDLYVAGMLPGCGKSRGERMCSAMAFLRECCGGKLMYTDHTPLMPAFGIADYCAISCDAVSDNLPAAYTTRYYRESASVRNASADIVFRRALNKRAFLSAPCSVSLDDKKTFIDGRLNSAEQNVLTNIEGLFTSVLVTNDSTATYDQKKKRRFQKMCQLSAGATDVKVKRGAGGFLVSYKLGGKAYVVKFK